MNISKVTTFYFSPTHSTKKVVENIAKGTGKEIENIDITFSWKDLKEYTFNENELVIVGSPVYAGRVPKVIREALRKIKGNNTPVVLVGVYGNRAFEDYFVEMQDIFEENNFIVIGAGAFLGTHSYTTKVATGRPTVEDLEKAFNFGKEIIKKLDTKSGDLRVELPGNRPYKADGPSRGVAPEPNENCKDCGQCIKVCPTEAISRENHRSIDVTKCILCHACVRFCKFNGREVKGDAIKPFIDFLEGKCSDYKEIELFI